MPVLRATEFIVGAITVGADAYIGTSCVLEEGVVVGDGAELQDLVALAFDTKVGAGEVWDGSPGRKTGMVDFPKPAATGYGVAGHQGAAIRGLCGGPVADPPAWPVADLSRFLCLRSARCLDGRAGCRPGRLSGLAAGAGVADLLRAGDHHGGVHRSDPMGRAAARHRRRLLRPFLVLCAQMDRGAVRTEITLDTLSSLFATIYMRAWYRLMGARIGKDAEISTNLSGRYDLVDIGEKCFIADEVVLGDEEIRRGWMTLKTVKTGARVFVGNDAVVPIGSDIPEGALIGIKSKPPANAAMSPGDTWFGTPPIKLPVRQRFDGGGAIWTFEPPRWKKFMVGFEAVHISLPTMLFIVFGTWSVELLGPLCSTATTSTPFGCSSPLPWPSRLP